MVGGGRKQVKYENIEAERARLGLSKDGFAKSLGIATKTYYNCGAVGGRQKNV